MPTSGNAYALSDTPPRAWATERRRQRIRTIVIPLCLSESSERSLLYGASLARRFNASIHLVSAYRVSVSADSARYTQLVREREAITRAAMNTRVQQLLERHPHIVIHTHHFVAGSPHHAIAQTAIELGADLIIMGRHTRSSLSRRLLGSVADRVVQETDVPVITPPSQ